MYLSNTTLFDGRGISSIYYIRYNYMFRRLIMAIFRLYMKYLVSSYTRLNMGRLQWGGRSWGGYEISYVSWRLGGVDTWGMYMWVNNSEVYGIIMCVVEIICTYIYLSYTYTMCNTIQEYEFCGCRFITLFKLLLYFTVTLNQVKHTIIYLFNSTNPYSCIVLHMVYV
jgi:hypothetical protein